MYQLRRELIDVVLMGIVFNNGVEIDRGFYESGKQWTEKDQSQRIDINSDYRLQDESRTYFHDDEEGIHFQEVWCSDDEEQIQYDSLNKK